MRSQKEIIDKIMEYKVQIDKYKFYADWHKQKGDVDGEMRYLTAMASIIDRTAELLWVLGYSDILELVQKEAEYGL